MDLKKIAKRIPVGLLMVAVGLLLVFLTDYLDLDTDLLGVMGAVLGPCCGLLYILAGWPTALMMAGFFLCLFLFQEGLGNLVFLAVLMGGGGLLGWGFRRRARLNLQKENPEMTKEEAEALLDQADALVSDTQARMEEYEAACAASGSCHLCTRKTGKLFRLFREGEDLYLIASGYQMENPFGGDDETTPGEEQLGRDKKNQRIPLRDLRSVTIQEVWNRQGSGRKALKVTFHTAGGDKTYYDLGLLEGRDLERLLREGMGLLVEGPGEYSPIPEKLLKLRAEAKPPKKVPSGPLDLAASLAPLWLLLYPKPLALALAVNALLPPVIFIRDRKKDVDNSGPFLVSGSVMALLLFLLFTAAGEAGMLLMPRFWLLLAPILPAWLVLTAAVWLLRRGSGDGWKQRCAQTVYCLVYAGTLLLMALTLL